MRSLCCSHSIRELERGDAPGGVFIHPSTIFDALPEPELIYLIFNILFQAALSVGGPDSTMSAFDRFEPRTAAAFSLAVCYVLLTFLKLWQL